MLVRLDDTRLKAQLAATAALAQMAKARLHQALIDQRRDRKLLATGDVTRAAMDLADTAVATDQAAVANAIAAEHSAATLLRHTRIISPISGIVTQKMVSVGDTVMPGEVLADLYNPAQLELDATVRESLANRLRRGEKLPVELTGFASPIIGSVRQIVPRVSTQTRSFIVKISAPFPRGAWPGVFGHVRVPIGTRRVLVVPQTAIQYVGQLSIVDISLDGRRRMQAIQTGRKIGSDREVLSGLQAGQRVWMAGRAGAGHSAGKKSG
jgi:RND family efflux transporter MFP subunit